MKPIIFFLLMMLPGAVMGQQSDGFYWLIPDDEYVLVDTMWSQDVLVDTMWSQDYELHECEIQFAFAIEKGSESVTFQNGQVIHYQPIREVWGICKEHDHMFIIISQQTTTIYYNPTK